MSTKIKPATQQDSEGAIFGAGIPRGWSWWHSFVRDGWDYPDTSPFHAPDGWVTVVTAEDPREDGKSVTVRIDHAAIMKAARRISGKKFDANRTTKEQARKLLLDIDACDIDACIADSILQVAVYGEIVYG